MNWTQRKSEIIYRSLNALVKGDVIAIFIKGTKIVVYANVFYYSEGTIALTNGATIGLYDCDGTKSVYESNTQCIYSTIKAFNRSFDKEICRGEVNSRKILRS